MLRPLLAFCVIFSAAAFAQETHTPSAAQPETQPYTFAVKSHLVSLPVTVRDSKGALVHDLRKEDLQLYEDGQLQTIRYLDIDMDRPLTVGLLVDNSGSVKDFVKQKHQASDIFFSSMLRKPGDTAFLVRFDDAVSMLQKPTGSRDALHAALETIGQSHQPQPVFARPPGDTVPERRPGTLLYDSIVVVCDKVTSRERGRKAIVILSDGEDNGSQRSLAAAIEAAQRSDTVIYTILYTKREDETDFANERHIDITKDSITTGMDVMQVLATTTGGHAYMVSRNMPLETIYANIAEEMRMQYTLSYVPQNRGSGYRRFELRSTTPGLQVQTRFGYYATE